MHILKYNLCLNDCNLCKSSTKAQLFEFDYVNSLKIKLTKDSICNGSRTEESKI